MFHRLLITRCFAGLAVMAGAIACAGGKGAPRDTTASSPTSTKASAARAATTPAGNDVDVVDALDTKLHLARPAQRIISLIPSATETLIAVGAIKQIVGRTRYDVAAEVQSVPSVGGGIDPSIEAILALHPDLVITWANDDRQAIRKKLLGLRIPVFVLLTEDTTDILRGITNIGRLSGHDSAAAALTQAIRDTFTTIARSVAGRPRPSVMFVVFPQPPMTAGPKTFLGQLIPLAGGRSIFADTSALWPNVSMEEIVQRDPDLLVVPVGEFKDNALVRLRAMSGWRELRAVREGHVVQVPADVVNRPGPSVASTARILRDAIHPEVASAK